MEKGQPAEAVPDPVVPHEVVHAHGYIEVRFNRGHYHWPAGTVLTNPEEIEHLRQRGAVLRPVPCQEASPQPDH
ncbi:hypothetical protein AA0616_2448 [Komagataeibacter nataicola NRIC 0616]|nr:hypothetical protein [Komagataeibacter nataicola]PYD65348.1 hypothetical protein CDI09_14185 [Komagataeibacter nataicola]GBR23120.1 hypothetical protein AA0616_2448 [Komagataeibacter nataicola NRIC 0616]